MRIARLVGMFWRRRHFPALILFIWATAFTISPPGAIAAQQRAARSLDSQLAARVNRLYPGFEEILTSDDPRTLARFARFLAERPSPDTLSVLVWMLRYCPAWDEHPVLQICASARAIKTLPVLLWQLRYGDRQFDNVVINGLVQGQKARRLPFEDLAAWLETENPDVRKTIAVLFERLLHPPTQLLPRDRQRVISDLIGALDDHNADVIQYAIQALGYVKAALAGVEREALASAALQPAAVDSRLIPNLPKV